MADNLSKQDRQKAMSAVKSTQTLPERRLRSRLIAFGVRGWRINENTLPGSPDFLFPDSRLAVFIHGCFWHRCPTCQKLLPKTNRSYWKRKITRNAKRDRENLKSLRKQGWKVLVVWEHQLKNSTDFRELAAEIKELAS